MTFQQKNRLKRQIQQAIQHPELYSLYFIYVAKNKVSLRFVSPYSWQGKDQFIGLCLSREDPRCFRLDQILKMKLVKSDEIRMPAPLTELVALPEMAVENGQQQNIDIMSVGC